MNTAPPRPPRPELVAACGLYCGECPSHIKGRCPGCKANAKAGWCKVRGCNQEKGASSCAACAEHLDPIGCKKFDNAIARVVGFVFNSNRAACIAQIREKGMEAHARAMAEAGRMSIPRRGKSAPK